MMNNKKMDKKQLKTRNREPQERLASVTVNEAGYKARIIQAGARASAGGTGIRKARLLHKPITPQRNLWLL